MSEPTFPSQISGGCLCRAVRYECQSAPLAMMNCHCRDCQKTSGAPYMPILVIRLSAFRLVAGQIQRHSSTRLNGKENVRGFCASCGSRLTVGEDAARDLIGISASSLDDPAIHVPEMDIFIEDAQKWDLLDVSIPKHRQYRVTPAP